MYASFPVDPLHAGTHVKSYVEEEDSTSKCKSEHILGSLCIIL